MKFVIPKPPTTNHIYAFTSRGGFARSYITKDGKEFFKIAEEEIRKQNKRKTPITTECEIWLEVYTSTRRDVDASIKPVLDVVEHAGVIENDSLFVAVHAVKNKCKKGEDRVEIEICGY